ncbi:MAG: HAD family hydrolase, partial [Ignavibacteriae bacterium]|nr:HAD family hydrolase [Ignavibacteriota bacterium]
MTQTNELIFASFNHVAQKYLGKTLTPAEIVSLFGPPEEGGLRNLVGAVQADVAMDELCKFYKEHHAEMASLHEGIEDMLRFLKDRRVKLALFTGKGNRTTGISLEALNIGHYFDLVVSGTDVVNHKPHSEGIEKVITTFRCDPLQVLMVGDSPADVKASRGAGVK